MARTLVVLSAHAGTALPAAALPALRRATQVFADGTVAPSLVEASGAVPLPDPAGWPADSVLLTSERDGHPLADETVAVDEPPGSMLPVAVAVMDRLRSEGGCPWDAEQTHNSLLQYLVEETYELHEAIDDADRHALREELGDVLLQVLFHARLAEEGSVQPFGPGAEPFSIDEVAGDLVRKLVNRHPHVFGSDPDAEPVLDATQQENAWDKLKQQEKQRESAMDGVAMGQPAVALAAKLLSRGLKAGVPHDLVDRGDLLWTSVVETKLSGADPEQQLRAAARRFAASVRAAEAEARAAGRDSHALTDDDWRTFWPS